MYSTHMLLAAVEAADPDEDVLTFTEVVAELPRDPASIFVIVLLILAFGAILWIGRDRHTGSRGSPGRRPEGKRATAGPV